MPIYLNLSFVRCLESCGFFKKPECYMINVMKINCGLIPSSLVNISVPAVVAIARHFMDYPTKGRV